MPVLLYPEDEGLDLSFDDVGRVTSTGNGGYLPADNYDPRTPCSFCGHMVWVYRQDMDTGLACRFCHSQEIEKKQEPREPQEQQPEAA
jgi:hypothetical protein